MHVSNGVNRFRRFCLTAESAERFLASRASSTKSLVEASFYYKLCPQPLGHLVMTHLKLSRLADSIDY